MDNYIVINGKKAELTKEQLEQLGINTSNNLWIELHPIPRKSKPRWVCPQCGIVIESEDQRELRIMHRYCGSCGHRNILY